MGFINVLLPKTSCAELQLKKKKDFVRPCAYMFLWEYVHT